MSTRNLWGRSTLHVLATTLTAAGAAVGAEWLDQTIATADEDGETLWYNALDIGLEGKGWKDTATPYDRLPERAKGVVRDPVWNLSLHSAGLCVRFRTNAQQIQAHWILRNKNLAMNHMPATGVSGLDLYVKTADNRWHWLAVGRPGAQENRVTLVSGIPPGEREYMLYLPLYNGVSIVEIGVPKTSRIARGSTRPAQRQRPIVFYGTSITQGGCASRPGMVHTAIIGRDLEVPVINLGFSGNGKMEPELADLLAELHPSVYVLDCLPNMNAEEVAERVVPFVQTLRRKRPDTPILLVEDRTYANSFLLPGQRRRNDASRKALRQAHQTLLEQNVRDLHYLPGDPLLGSDGEATVDGSHPTDLGFMRQAKVMSTALAPLVE